MLGKLQESPVSGTNISTVSTFQASKPPAIKIPMRLYMRHLASYEIVHETSSFLGPFGEERDFSGSPVRLEAAVATEAVEV